jgi:putative efflux protein, MATE family
LEPSL